MKRAVWMLGFLLACLSLSAGKPQVLGVLEEPQQEGPARPMARLLFVKKGAEWVPLDHGLKGLGWNPLGRRQWQLVRDGHELGTLRLHDPDPSQPDPGDGFYTRDKLFEPVSEGKLPTQANDGKGYAGWIRLPSIRPVVLLSRAISGSPSGWRAFKPGAEYRARLLSPLKKAFKEVVVRCVSEGGPAEPFEIQPEHLVLYGGFRSEVGLELISAGLNPALYHCDDLMDPEWSDHWFLVDGPKVTCLGREWELVDIGDFDQDGQLEFLFWHSGYDEDGYVLVYDHFRKQAEYLWGYH